MTHDVDTFRMEITIPRWKHIGTVLQVQIHILITVASMMVYSRFT